MFYHLNLLILQFIQAVNFKQIKFRFIFLFVLEHINLGEKIDVRGPNFLLCSAKQALSTLYLIDFVINFTTLYILWAFL